MEGFAGTRFLGEFFSLQESRVWVGESALSGRGLLMGLWDSSVGVVVGVAEVIL